MRRLPSVILVLLLISVLPGLAFAEPLSVPVGKESTWINLDTGEQHVHGQRVRRIEIDTALVRGKCVRAVDGFEGFIRLRHERRDRAWKVRVECMQRIAPAQGGEPAPSMGTASRDSLEAGEDTAAGKS